jgi:tetratricopeptide (TPR) repeat protein
VTFSACAEFDALANSAKLPRSKDHTAGTSPHRLHEDIGITMIRRVSLALLLLLFAPLGRADFNDGVVALMTGKYEEALKTFLPLAETSNHAFAQYFLARMYADGQGVPQDHKLAAEWYQKAAHQGVADAQYRLGSLYESGEGVPVDMEYAYGWYSVAAHLGNAKGSQAMEQAKSKLSGNEMVEAEKLSRDLINKYGKIPESTSRTQ